MRNLFLEALERVPDMTEREKQVVGDLYNTVFGENTPDADIVDQATDEPPLSQSLKPLVNTRTTTSI